MAHSRTANKRIRQNARRRMQNRTRRSRVKTQTKRVLVAIEKDDVAAAEKELQQAYKVLDKIGHTPAIHKKTAARKKSRLAKKVNALRAAKTSD